MVTRVSERSESERSERRSRSRWLYRFSQPLRCAGCGTFNTGEGRGWRGYRTDDPATDQAHEIVFYCAYCAIRELG